MISKQCTVIKIHLEQDFHPISFLCFVSFVNDKLEELIILKGQHLNNWYFRQKIAFLFHPLYGE